VWSSVLRYRGSSTRLIERSPPGGVDSFDRYQVDLSSDSSHGYWTILCH
jgi:hypothetical protein